METQKKILIMEDDPGILGVIKIVLEDKGFAVVSVARMETFEERIKEFSPDVVLVDLWMPGVDGEEIIRKLKGQRRTKKIPIIVVSALADGQKKAQEAGANDFLAKPFDIDNLVSLVRKWANR